MNGVLFDMRVLILDQKRVFIGRLGQQTSVNSRASSRTREGKKGSTRCEQEIPVIGLDNILWRCSSRISRMISSVSSSEIASACWKRSSAFFSSMMSSSAARALRTSWLKIYEMAISNLYKGPEPLGRSREIRMVYSRRAHSDQPSRVTLCWKPFR